jgi:hypothetical protein
MDSLARIYRILGAAGVTTEVWYGLGVFTAPQPAAEVLDADFALLLDVEVLAGGRDPYRRAARQLHVLGRRARTLSTPAVEGR